MKLSEAFNTICTYLKCYGLDQMREELDSESLPSNMKEALTDLIWYMGYYPTDHNYIKEDVEDGTLPYCVKDSIFYIISCFGTDHIRTP